MASQLIGRCECPWCGFASAHVKRSERCAYMHCPDCGAQYHSRPGRQEENLLAKTRLDDPAPGPTPTGKAPEPAPVDPAMPPTPTPPTPTQAKQRVGLFGLREA